MFAWLLVAYVVKLNSYILLLPKMNVTKVTLKEYNCHVDTAKLFIHIIINKSSYLYTF